MPLSYLLELATPTSPDDVTNRLRELIPGISGSGPLFSVPAMNISLRAVDDSSREVALEVWDLEPTLRVTFHVQSNAPDEEYAAARRDLSTASAALAVQFAREAVLHFQGDQALLRRRDGVLFLYDWWPEWADAQVAGRLPQPFETVHGKGIPTPGHNG